ncbi:hypothetical protein B9Z39_03385 [Limnohabitans sp. JirII-29]|uniref:helix-turn-helix transcriptional regulator n=1 Tax=Limnohabitans sp. JirII-29 TaxID=1835756 RepID=UPI000D3D3C92|nr:helix-turn-helix transcriptional regulator [Limnohabitans sp. JirII-29]PUE29130.1 hypothetical protein B9Z39_03385 [Limnohabitans sp. JirII-29]
MNLQELGVAVHERREALGLSQLQLAKLANLSRTTIVLLERGSLKDLGISKAMVLMDVIGLTLETHPLMHHQKQGLVMASRMASVSYREKLSTKELALAMATGDIPHKRKAHLATLLDEVPVSVLVSAVSEASRKTSVPPKMIWTNLTKWAHHFQSPRSVWC